MQFISSSVEDTMNIAKKFATLKKLIKEQEKHLIKDKKYESDLGFDWVEDFEKYAMLTGAFSRDI